MTDRLRAAVDEFLDVVRRTADHTKWFDAISKLAAVRAASQPLEVEHGNDALREVSEHERRGHDDGAGARDGEGESSGQPRLVEVPGLQRDVATGQTATHIGADLSQSSRTIAANLSARGAGPQPAAVRAASQTPEPQTVRRVGDLGNDDFDAIVRRLNAGECSSELAGFCVLAITQLRGAAPPSRPRRTRRTGPMSEPSLDEPTRFPSPTEEQESTR